MLGRHGPLRRRDPGAREPGGETAHDPQQYPLTLNALTLACSQSSNRDPVVDYDEDSVEAAVTSVKTQGPGALRPPVARALRPALRPHPRRGLGPRHPPPGAVGGADAARSPDAGGAADPHRAHGAVRGSPRGPGRARRPRLPGPSPWWCACAGARARKRTATASCWEPRRPPRPARRRPWPRGPPRARPAPRQAPPARGRGSRTRRGGGAADRGGGVAGRAATRCETMSTTCASSSGPDGLGSGSVRLRHDGRQETPGEDGRSSAAGRPAPSMTDEVP